MMGAPNVWNESNHVPCNGKILIVPLSQVIALPSRPNKEAIIMDKADFRITGLSNKQKGDLQQSTSHGTSQKTPSKKQCKRHFSTRGKRGYPHKGSSSFSLDSNEGEDDKKG
jgi:hypothetical protein